MNAQWKFRPKPRYMVTYQCTHCGMDSGRTELDTPQCFYCEATDGLTEVKRELLTPEVMAARMKLCADRMMENLAKAHEVLQRDGEDVPHEETMLLKAMTKGQDFQRKIHNLATKMVRRKKGKK